MISSNWYDYSTCKGCPYGERITAGVFCSELQGLVPVGYVGCKAERDYYEEIDKKGKGITLTELAHELRKIFKFKYLAYGEMFYWGQVHNVLLVSDEPLTLVVRDEGGEGVPCYIHEWECKGEGMIDVFAIEDLAINLDLSEYKDEAGEIDYSKCIVEVE